MCTLCGYSFHTHIGVGYVFFMIILGMLLGTIPNKFLGLQTHAFGLGNAMCLNHWMLGLNSWANLGHQHWLTVRMYFFQKKNYVHRYLMPWLCWYVDVVIYMRNNVVVCFVYFSFVCSFHLCFYIIAACTEHLKDDRF